MGSGTMAVGVFNFSSSAECCAAALLMSKVLLDALYLLLWPCTWFIHVIIARPRRPSTRYTRMHAKSRVAQLRRTVRHALTRTGRGVFRSWVEGFEQLFSILDQYERNVLYIVECGQVSSSRTWVRETQVSKSASPHTTIMWRVPLGRIGLHFTDVYGFLLELLFSCYILLTHAPTVGDNLLYFDI